MRILAHRFRMLLAHEGGVAYIEFALSLSILLMLFLGSIEVTRYILIMQKLEKAVETVADVVTQADANTDPLTTAQMSALMGAVPDLMNPYTFGTNGLVVVTDISKTGTSNPVINWQYCGGGTLVTTSKLGSTIGGAATLPTGYTMIAGEEVVIAEIFYSYSPIIASSWTVMTASTIYRTSLFMPRIGALTAFSSHC
jgi:Flp pilus assembly protein TadG